MRLLEYILSAILFLVMGLTLGVALIPAALFVRWAFSFGWYWGVVSLGPAFFIFGFALMSLVVLWKWGTFYRAKEGAWPFISFQSARWAITAKFHDLVRFFFLGHIRGSPFINLYFRLMGVKVGKSVIINTTEISDWDLIHIGDKTMLGDSAVVLGHVGEKGQLTFRPVHIGKGCTIGRDTAIFPGVTVEDGAILAAMTIVPKDKTLPAGTMWAGTSMQKISK